MRITRRKINEKSLKPFTYLVHKRQANQPVNNDGAFKAFYSKSILKLLKIMQFRNSYSVWMIN